MFSIYIPQRYNTKYTYTKDFFIPKRELWWPRRGNTIMHKYIYIDVFGTRLWLEFYSVVYRFGSLIWHPVVFGQIRSSTHIYIYNYIIPRRDETIYAHLNLSLFKRAESISRMYTSAHYKYLFYFLFFLKNLSFI